MPRLAAQAVAFAAARLPELLAARPEPAPLGLLPPDLLERVALVSVHACPHAVTSRGALQTAQRVSRGVRPRRSRHVRPRRLVRLAGGG
jgi:hypothetical protein